MAVESKMSAKQRASRKANQSTAAGRGDGTLSVEAAALLDWYRAAARALPWRIGPQASERERENVDPYRVWLSEIMLQQTTVAAVKAYFEKFTERWPTVAALAGADEAEIMAAWAGLGYYARARNLHACAKQVVAVHGGRFPDTEAGLRTLPGIGDYTAAAIAAIAFGRRAIVVDANVERVVSRLYAVITSLPAAKAEIKRHLDVITPSEASGKTGDFAQALMDLGATICTPKAPKCLLCPLHFCCEGAAEGIAETLPRKAAKVAKPHREGWLWWIEKDGQLLLERRPAKGLLGGMLALPGSDWVASGGPERLPDDAVYTGRSVQHVFTHFSLKLHIARRDPDHYAQESAHAPLWYGIDILDEVGLPTLYRKVIMVMK